MQQYIGTEKLIVDMPADLKVKFRDKCVKENTTIKDKTIELIEGYIECQKKTKKK